MDRTKLLTLRQVLSFVGKYYFNTVKSKPDFSIYNSFNLDKTRGKKCLLYWRRALTIYGAEEYEAEVENMNTVMMAENQSLQHDNKQLNALIKEYEQTLETLMSWEYLFSVLASCLTYFLSATFRNRAVCGVYVW